jgi:hypothetical protein
MAGEAKSDCDAISEERDDLLGFGNGEINHEAAVKVERYDSTIVSWSSGKKRNGMAVHDDIPVLERT